jgi:hypothetical protein
MIADEPTNKPTTKNSNHEHSVAFNSALEMTKLGSVILQWDKFRLGEQEMHKNI